MTIQNQINKDIKQAMLDKSADKLAALRAVKSAIMLEASKDGSSEISDEICLKLISKLVKQRKDSSVIYIEQGRQDLADDELKQISHLECYLPEQISKDEVRKVVKEVIEQVGASSPADIGKCMGILISRLNGKADGKLISEIVRKELSN